MLSLSLLQVNTAKYLEDTNSPTAFIFMGAIMVLLVAFIVFGSRSGAASGSGGKSGGLSLRRLCKQHGLEPEHFHILKRAVKDQKIQSPGALFTNGRFLNNTLRTLIAQVERSDYGDADKEALKAEIFEIKQRISVHTPALKQAMSTKGMAVNQDVVIYSRDLPPYPSELTGKSAESLSFILPRSASGDWVPYRIGQVVKIRYIKDADKVFSFVSRVKDVSRDMDGDMKLLVEHTSEVKRVQLRKSPRKEFFRSAYFYRVEVISEGRGRKAVRKAVVDKNRRFGGNMQDLSAGGCAILARTPLPKGALIMISFDITKGNSISVFGKVRNLHKERASTLMHVMFTKVSTKHLNEIKAMVFGFAEEDDKPRNNYLIG